MPKQNVILGLDIGSSKVTACVGGYKEGIIDIIGVGKSINTGLRKGIVADIEETVSAISAVLEETERMAGIPLTSAVLGVSGTHITSTSSKGVIAVSRADGEITSADIDRVIEAARAVALPPNMEILHVIPKSFTVDGQTGIKDPIGMTGIRLETEAHVIGGSTNAIRNLTKCVTQSGLEIDDLMFSPLATSKALLSKKQKELGVILIDFGAGATEIAVFEEGNIIHCAVLPIGSIHITNDIAIGLRISLELAEKVKLKYATTQIDKIRDTEKVNLSDLDPSEEQKPQRKYLAQIVEARLMELFSMIKDELKKIGKDGMLPAGVVFTGGGSKLEGLIDFTKEYLRLPTQIGLPMLEVSGMVDKLDDPVYTTSVGLMLWGIDSGQTQTQSKFNLGMAGPAIEKTKNFFKQFLP